MAALPATVPIMARQSSGEVVRVLTDEQILVATELYGGHALRQLQSPETAAAVKERAAAIAAAEGPAAVQAHPAVLRFIYGSLKNGVPVPRLMESIRVLYTTAGISMPDSLLSMAVSCLPPPAEGSGGRDTQTVTFNDCLRMVAAVFSPDDAVALLDGCAKHESVAVGALNKQVLGGMERGLEERTGEALDADSIELMRDLGQVLAGPRQAQMSMQLALEQKRILVRRAVAAFREADTEERGKLSREQLTALVVPFVREGLVNMITLPIQKNAVIQKNPSLAAAACVPAAAEADLEARVSATVTRLVDAADLSGEGTTDLWAFLAFIVPVISQKRVGETMQRITVKMVQDSMRLQTVRLATLLAEAEAADLSPAAVREKVVASVTTAIEEIVQDGVRRVKRALDNDALFHPGAASGGSSSSGGGSGGADSDEEEPAAPECTVM